MATTLGTVNVIRRKTSGNTTTIDSRNNVIKWVFTSGKVSGGFISLPNGSKFRRTTAQTKTTVTLQPRDPQESRGTDSNKNLHTVYIGPGGWKSDDILSANCPPIITALGGPGKLTSPATVPASMRNEAVTKALLKIADQKAGIGEDLATFRQLQKMLSSPAGALLGSLKSAWNDKSLRPYLTRSVRSLRNQGVAKAISGKYLEYVYGWLPLMGDIHGIVDLMKKTGDKPLLLYGKGHSSQQAQAPVGTFNNVSDKCLSVLGPTEVSGKVQCKLWARIDPNSSGLRTVNQLGLLNPVSLAYELTPWSFVVDWFVPIGSVLSALTAPAGLIFVNGSVSGRWSLSGPFTNNYYGLDTSNTSGHPASGLAEQECWRRDELTAWPLPGFWANPNPFSSDRPLKALALAIQNLKGLRV